MDEISNDRYREVEEDAQAYKECGVVEPKPWLTLLLEEWKFRLPILYI